MIFHKAVATLVLVTTLPYAVYGAIVPTCDQQAACVKFSRTKVNNNVCAGDACEIRVCMALNYGGDCLKGIAEDISYICAQNRRGVLQPAQCFDNPFNFKQDLSDYFGDVRTGGAYCVTVAGGDDAIFIINDEGTCSSPTNLTLYKPPRMPTGTTCGPSTAKNYNNQPWAANNNQDELESCTSQGGVNVRTGLECIWTIPTSCNANVAGDPHFQTWLGDKYDYHGACDMILLQNSDFGNGLGMDIHIRTKHRGQFSYITSAALRIGDEILEVTGRDKKYYLNSVANAEMPNKLSGYSVTYKDRSSYQSTFLVHLDKQTIVMKTFRDFVSVTIEHPLYKSFSGSLGMMGDYETGHLLGRDGKTVYDHTDKDSLHAFALDWQVKGNDLRLFQQVQTPQFPQECALPPVSSTDSRRRLSEGVSEEVAKKACGMVSPDDFDFCVYDVMTTNDVTSAGAY